MEIVTKVMEKSWKSHGNLLVKMCTNPERDDRPSNHHADARSPGQPTPPFIPETLSVRGRDIIAALSNDRLVSKH